MPPRTKHPSSSQSGGGSSSNHPQISSEFLSRPIHCGRLVDFNFFEVESFTFTEKLIKQGWKFMCQNAVNYYPELIREFYQNIIFDDDSGHTKVLGVEIHISIETLGRALKVPINGLKTLDDEERNVVTATVLENENATGAESVLAKDVSVDTRVLHHFVANALIPKYGRFDMINEHELHFIYHILRENQICLPWILLCEMKKVNVKRKGILPYGILLTHVFKAAGLNLKKEFGKPIKQIDFYNANSLHRMGINKKDGKWCRTRVLSAPPELNLEETSPQEAGDDDSSSPLR